MRMVKKDIFKQVYICHGANCRDGLSYGACGTIQTLSKWLEDLFPSHKTPFEEFFKGFKEKEILDYIYTFRGLSLSKDIHKYI